MIAVIETSAAVAVALGRSVPAALSQTLVEAELVLAPELFVAEITNLFWRYHHREGMPLPECKAALEDAMALPDEIVAQRELSREVFAMACHAGSTAYNMFFVVLARRYDAALLTVDPRLREVAVKLGVGQLG